MKVIKVRVIPNAKKNSIFQEGDMFKIHVVAQPVGGKANKAMIDLLAEFFKVKKRDIRIIKGESAREKVVEVNIDGNSNIV